ncbi:hypothetical protein EDD16DRAFT_1580441 [Pisolithus croceorrhizus]|nr:hypothetical protein EDD16DRAFT_1580441 [Pisolithus croceorrhizus]
MRIYVALVIPQTFLRCHSLMSCIERLSISWTSIKLGKLNQPENWSLRAPVRVQIDKSTLISNVSPMIKMQSLPRERQRRRELRRVYCMVLKKVERQSTSCESELVCNSLG